MRIIKPYGRSETEFEAGKNLQRAIRRKSRLGAPNDTPVDIVKFTQNHPQLVIAQWISAIDKIASKPKRGDKKPTPEQLRLRQQLGEAALEVLTEKKLLDLSDGKDELTRLWWSKIHPYGKKTDDKGVSNPKGRWYERFAGDTDVSTVDAAAIAKKIHEHLSTTEYRIHGSRPNKRAGRITARAKSIRGSAFRPPSDGDIEAAQWTDEDKKQYEATGDIARKVADEAKKLEQDNKRVSMRTAAPILYDQYGRLFKADDGSALSVSKAREQFPGLFALHMAVKDAYVRLLKNHKKKSVAPILPKDMPALFRLVGSKSDNRDLNALVRLGKVIHYEATPSSGGDTPRNVLTNWPNDITHSRYWTTEGQSEIKRTEAFVRVWRHTIALAAQTLKDWADPQGNIHDDILLRVEKATGQGFDANAHSEKLFLLFGNQANLFRTKDDAAVLRLALEGWAKLRHTSFHFKGLGGFAAALTSNPHDAEDDTAAVAAARQLWKGDLENRSARLIESLRAAHVEHYFEQNKLNALVDAVVGAELPQSPLPRFRRVLTRAENAWRHESYRLNLPAPGNRAELEKEPGRLCQYIATKTLYERAFPAWLEQQSAQTLNKWIEHAVKRTTEAAQSINDEFAVAKAAGVIRLSEGQGIAHFFDHLSAETATELRVQRGYDSDADNARKQAKYLDDLRCDVVGQAFEKYLNANALAWVLDDLDTGPLPEKKSGRLDTVPLPKHAEEAENDWEAVLYFLIHLVPVDAVGRLQHQLRKWSILEGNPSSEAKAVQRVFSLYLDMHDAKFEGGEGMTGAEALKSLFEPEEAFHRVCPEQPGQDTRQYVPYRGLREILRFGCLEPLRPIFQQHPIKTDQVNELAEWEKTADGDSRIATQQAERERLHEKWAKSKNRFSDKDNAMYSKALADVVRHRHLAAHVRLNNHARLHRLLMQVLGRLVDYAGLWERDLYFVTLALLSQCGKTSQQVFHGNGGQADIETGQIVKALRGLKNVPDGQQLLDQVKHVFGDDFPFGEKAPVSVRNNLMHFNMLRDSTTSLNLTEIVNQTRRLMTYDRKLKNAVSKSIIEMLAREGFDLTWEMKEHRLADAKIKARQAVHLGGKTIKENLHGETFVAMVATLFGGEPIPTDDDVCSIDFDKTERDRHSSRSPKGGKNRRNRRGNRDQKRGFSPRKG